MATLPSALRGPGPAQVAPQAAAPSRVGPNAIIQVGEVLRDRFGDAVAHQVFELAGLRGMVTRPPDGMVEEGAAAALFASLFAELQAATAAAVAAEAGARTADYLLANRIPSLAQTALRLLPASLAAPLLLRAIARNAWTFAGSGGFSAGPPGVIEIVGNPLAMPGCVWHVAVFKRLFRALVSPASTVRHTRCCHAGACLCRFDIAVHDGKGSRPRRAGFGPV